MRVSCIGPRVALSPSVTRTWAGVVGGGAGRGLGDGVDGGMGLGDGVDVGVRGGMGMGVGEGVGVGLGGSGGVGAGVHGGMGVGAGMGEVGQGAGAATVEASPRGAGGECGWWREAGVLDRLRLRHAAVVARARVRATEPVAAGALIVVGAGPSADSGLWARVEQCEGAPDGTFRVVLALLG